LARQIFSLWIDVNLWSAFAGLCRANDESPGEVIERLMRAHLEGWRRGKGGGEEAADMSEAINLEKHQREVARWQILRVLDAGRPAGVNAGVILEVLRGGHVNCTLDDVHRELDYLGGLGLVEVGEDYEFAKLAAQGVAVVEFNAPVPAGIARPKRSAGVN
jgi:hypothetical protein